MGQIDTLDRKLLTPQDVATRLQISPQRVRQMEAEGKLVAARTVGGYRIFHLEDVERMAEERSK